MQSFFIGRDQSNQIILNDNMVSRRHAQLTLLDNGLVMIKDLGSSNGTYVNGKKITETYLSTGDIVKCGPVFLNWSQYISGGTHPGQPASYQQPVSNQPYSHEQISASKSVQYGLGDVFKYLISGLFNIGDLFKSNWNRTNSIIFLKGIPILLTFFILLLFQSKSGIVQMDFRIVILSILIFSVPPFFTIWLLSQNKKIPLDKIALASGIIGFLSFCIFFLLVFLIWIYASYAETLFTYSFLSETTRPNSFTTILALLIGFILLLLMTIIRICSFVFIYLFFESTGSTKSVSFYLVPTTLFITFFFQVTIFYLLFENII
jgi:hypothetical protein